MHLTGQWEELSDQSVRAALCPYTMYAVLPGCPHTYAEANEAIRDHAHLKIFLHLHGFVYVYLCTRAVYSVHTGHLTRQSFMHPFPILIYPVCVFPALSHYHLCISLSLESVKHGELLEHSCFEKKTKHVLVFYKKNNSCLITACSITADVLAS